MKHDARNPALLGAFVTVSRLHCIVNFRMTFALYCQRPSISNTIKYGFKPSCWFLIMDLHHDHWFLFLDVCRIMCDFHLWPPLIPYLGSIISLRRSDRTSIYSEIQRPVHDPLDITFSHLMRVSLRRSNCETIIFISPFSDVVFQV